MFEKNKTLINTGIQEHLGINRTNSDWVDTNLYTGGTVVRGSRIDLFNHIPSNLNILNNLSISNLSNMKTKQVKAAVFTVERNDKNEVVSSKFIKELWVEVKNGTSLDLVVAKELKGDFDPETTVVREVYSVTF
jgi:hypothetical protein